MKEIDLKGKKVLVMGLGLWGGGVATVRFLKEVGCSVRVTDLKTERELAPSLAKLSDIKDISFTLGEHKEEDFLWADLIVYNPSISASRNPFLQKALSWGKKILTPEALFSYFYQGSVIAVTGTKGKSTTASLLYHVLKEAFGNKVFLGGNIGVSPLSFVLELTPDSIVVLELSSWQIEGLRGHPLKIKRAVFTNIFPDHLNHYQSFEDYVGAKLSLISLLEEKGLVIANGKDEILKRALSYHPRVIWYLPQRFDDLPSFFQKEHNLLNLGAVLETGKSLGLGEQEILESVKTWKPLEGRQEIIGEYQGRVFVNDTTATNPGALKVALLSFPPGKIILIAGGSDKNLNFKKVLPLIESRCKKVILLPGTATEKLIEGLSCQYISVENMEEAVWKAWESSDPGDIILLSPGAASFGLFANEKERGKAFCEAVKKLFNL